MAQKKKSPRSTQPQATARLHSRYDEEVASSHPSCIEGVKQYYTKPPKTMLSQIMQRRLVPVLSRAAQVDSLPRLFSGLNVTMRNTSNNVTAARSIGSVAPLSSNTPVRIGVNMNSLIMPPRCILANNTNFATSNNVMLGPSPIISQHQARGFASKKHKRVIKLSKGFRGRANRCFRVAIRRLEKSWQYAYRDRKVKKREFRKLWIQRLNAGVRQQGLSYSRFIQMEGKSGVKLDRKILSGLAMYEPFSFKAVVDVVKKMSAESN